MSTFTRHSFKRSRLEPKIVVVRNNIPRCNLFVIKLFKSIDCVDNSIIFYSHFGCRHSSSFHFLVGLNTANHIRMIC